MVIDTLEDAYELLNSTAFDPTTVEHGGTIIGTFNGQPVEVRGYSATEFYDLGCLKIFGVRNPLVRIAEILDKDFPDELR